MWGKGAQVTALVLQPAAEPRYFLSALTPMERLRKSRGNEQEFVLYDPGNAPSHTRGWYLVVPPCHPMVRLLEEGVEKSWK